MAAFLSSPLVFLQSVRHVQAWFFLRLRIYNFSIFYLNTRVSCNCPFNEQLLRVYVFGYLNLPFDSALQASVANSCQGFSAGVAEKSGRESKILVFW
jgi:hypothetical protein